MSPKWISCGSMKPAPLARRAICKSNKRTMHDDLPVVRRLRLRADRFGQRQVVQETDLHLSVHASTSVKSAAKVGKTRTTAPCVSPRPITYGGESISIVSKPLSLSAELNCARDEAPAMSVHPTYTSILGVPLVVGRVRWTVRF